MEKLKKSIEKFREDGTQENLMAILKAIDNVRASGRTFITPVSVDGEMPEGEELDPEKVELTRISDGKSAYLVAFTSMDELKKGPESAALHVDIEALMDVVLDNVDIAGIVIDPWTSSFMFKDDLIRVLKEMIKSKSVRVHDVSEDFFVFAPEPKPLDLIINVRNLMPSFPEVEKVYLTGLNNGGIESYLLLVEFSGIEMGTLFSEILKKLPQPADGRKVDMTPFTTEVPVAELIYEKVL